jgi:hypothetical protein
LSFDPGATYPWLYRYSVPFQAPDGHWIRYVAPSASVPLTVLTEPEPPQEDGDATAVLAVSPPATRPVTSASPAILFDRSTGGNLPAVGAYREIAPRLA